MQTRSFLTDIIFKVSGGKGDGADYVKMTITTTTTTTTVKTATIIQL